MLTTKVIKDWGFVSQYRVEMYLTAMDDYLSNNLGIHENLMLVILFKIEVNNNLEQEKDKLRDYFLKLTQDLQEHLTIKVIDPATGYFLDNYNYNLSQNIDIPRVISRLNNNCYEYQQCCQGKHYLWGEAVYPSLILLDSTTPTKIIAIINQFVNSDSKNRSQSSTRLE